jgi:hypothetical protein
MFSELDLLLDVTRRLEDAGLDYTAAHRELWKMPGSFPQNTPRSSIHAQGLSGSQSPRPAPDDP